MSSTMSKYHVRKQLLFLSLTLSSFLIYLNFMSEKDFKPNPEIVYLDTSIPRFYFDDRPKSQLNREITREWWAKRSKDFYICTSTVTLNELKARDYANKEE